MAPELARVGVSALVRFAPADDTECAEFRRLVDPLTIVDEWMKWTDADRPRPRVAPRSPLIHLRRRCGRRTINQRGRPGSVCAACLGLLGWLSASSVAGMCSVTVRSRERDPTPTIKTRIPANLVLAINGTTGVRGAVQSPSRACRLHPSTWGGAFDGGGQPSSATTSQAPVTADTRTTPSPTTRTSRPDQHLTCASGRRTDLPRIARHCW